MYSVLFLNEKKEANTNFKNYSLVFVEKFNKLIFSTQSIGRVYTKSGPNYTTGARGHQRRSCKMGCDIGCCARTRLYTRFRSSRCHDSLCYKNKYEIISCIRIPQNNIARILIIFNNIYQVNRELTSTAGH